MSRTIWVGAVAYDPKVVTIWEGMRRYFHEETSCRSRWCCSRAMRCRLPRCWPRPRT